MICLTRECRVENARARARAISKRRKVDVVPVRAPTACRSAPLTQFTTEPSSLPGPGTLTVLVHGGDEDVLHLEIALGCSRGPC